MKSIKKLVIEKERLKHNLNILKEKAGGVVIFAVLKGNAYGLGTDAAEFLIDNGIDKFAVSRIDEAISLRSIGIEGEILNLFSTSDTDEVNLLIDNKLTAAVGSFEALALLQRVCEERGETVNAHIKIDSGFGRYGFTLSDLSRLVTALNNSPNVHITGIFTHLSDAFGKNRSHSQNQFEIFDRALEFLSDSGIYTGIRHALNSNGLFRFHDRLYDGVRIGSALLGRVNTGRELLPVGTLKVSVQEIKVLKKGKNVGYGNVCRTKRDTKVAVLPLGTSDGIGITRDRGLYRFVDKLRFIKEDLLLNKKRRISCIVNGKRAFILGRPCLTSLMIDVTDIECAAGDICEFKVNPLFINPLIEREFI